jgi:hypothetical protein
VFEVVNRLKAFEIFLEKNPSYLEDVRMVMLCVPSRSHVPQANKLTYSINSKGLLKVKNEFIYGGKLNDAQMPRFGMNFTCPCIQGPILKPALRRGKFHAK